MIGGSSLALLEREKELAFLRAALDRARAADGGLVLIEGEAGIGKTCLLDESSGLARRSGFRVLRARGSEMEQSFGFGVVRQLLTGPLRAEQEATRTAVLSGPARFAAPVLGLTEQPITETDATQSALFGLFWLVANLAEQQPVLLAIDDAHLADQPSLRFLRYLARRLEEMPVLVGLVARSGATETEEMLRELSAEPVASKLKPAPLTVGAVSEIVRATLAPDADDEVCAACHCLTAGNPFLLRELLTELRAAYPAQAAITAGAVSDLGSKGIATGLLQRVSRLGARASALARAVVILGDGAQLRHATLLTDLDAAATGPVVDALVSAAVLTAREGLAFVHPIARTAMYDSIPTGERSRLHARAAQILVDEDADPEAVSAHLLACEPRGDPEMTGWLRKAAISAGSRGAPEVAASYLRRALIEQPRSELRGSLLAELGRYEFLAGELAAAAEHLSLARDQLTAKSAERIHATEALSGLYAMSERVPQAIAVLQDQLEALGDSDPASVGRLISHAVNLARMAPSVRRSAQVEHWIRELARRVAEDDERDPLVLISVAADLAMAGAPCEATGTLAERGLAAMSLDDFSAWSSWAPYAAVRVLVTTERFDAAQTTLDAAIGASADRGSGPAEAVLRCFRSELHLRLGQLVDAEHHARMAHAIALEQGPPIAIGGSLAWLIDAIAQQGNLAEADALATAEFPHAPEALREDYTFNFVLSVRGRLRLEQGRHAEAVADLLECGRRLDVLGELSPGLFAWRRHAALALAGLDQLDEARHLATTELELARRLGSPRAIGAALRVAGRLCGEADSVELLEDAAQTLARTPALLEHAKASLDLGAALQRAGRRAEARPRLTIAMELADRCGARKLTDECSSQLRLAGARPRRQRITGRAALTAGELRVAGMAATGMANKQIARSLFVTQRTVEMHLTNSYRKLNISSRSQLSGALASDEQTVARPATP